MINIYTFNILFKQVCISCKLLQACKYDLQSTALELLEFGNIDYNYVDKNGDTAFKYGYV